MSSIEVYETITSCSFEGLKLAASEERASIGLPEPDHDFIQKFLVPTATVPKVAMNLVPLIQAFLTVNEEKKMYSKLISIFDDIAQSLRVTADASCQRPLFFLSSPNSGPSSNIRSRFGSIMPDIVVLPNKTDSDKFLKEELTDHNGIVLRFPWATLLSAIEVKLDTDWSNRQVLQYIHTILENRPDKVNMIGMSCNKTGFRFYYVDACVQQMSIVFKWDQDLDKLVHFVYSLHRRYAEDLDQDKSMQLQHVQWDGIYATAFWQSSYEGKKYLIQRIFQHRGRGRRTWIGVGTLESGSDNEECTSAIRVVKDMWRDNSRRYEEGDLLRRIHANGFIPGVVRSVAGGPMNLVTGGRTKHRIVMGSTGLRLSACQSVLEFLQIIYDAIEAHETMMEKGVLHRDISWYNVLCHPRHYIGEDNVINRPNIGKILGESDSQPLCLLTDFDNAALIDDNKESSAGTERTGTPMFMACELAYGDVAYDCFKLRPPSITPSSFVLEDDILKRYTSVYGEERYDKYNTFLSSVLKKDFQTIDPFSAGNRYPPHQPHHDMESFYWIIVWFIAKAWPRGSDPYPGRHKGLQELMTSTLLSRRTPGHKAYPVTDILMNDGRWEISLHPDFKSLAKMLACMGEYLRIPWSGIQELEPYWWHSHEAMKRLLLKEIIRISNSNDPIPIQGPRPSLPGRIKAIASLSKTGTSGRPTLTSSRVDTLPSSTHSSSRRGSIQSSQPSQKSKRIRSNSVSTGTGNASKKQRSNAPPRLLRVSARANAFVHHCLNNIASDDKWFNEPSLF